jgi:hypothetical protein
MSRQINNTTAGQLFIDDIGVAIDPGIYTIPPERYWYFASSADIDPFIDSGDFVIINNGHTLDAFDGKCLIHEGTDYVDLKEDGVFKDRKTKEIDFTGGLLQVIDRTDGKAELTIRGLVLNRKAGIGFTRKGGFILDRNCE